MIKSPYQNYIVTDCETGGLPGKTSAAFDDIALTEIAIVVVNSKLEQVEEFSWLIKPYKEDLIYSKGAEIASGISKEMCEKQGEDLQKVFLEIKQVFNKYKDGRSLPVILGHNFVNFDSNFFINMFRFFKDDLTKYVNNEPEDTIKWARLMWPESLNYKLGTCVERAGITLTNAHRALSDTKATAELWIHFMKNLRGLSVTSVENQPKKFRESFEL